MSSVGSLTLTVCLIAFMAKAGYSFVQIGLLVGSARIVPVIINLFFGELADRLSPKKIVFWSELCAGLASVGLYFAWVKGPSYFYFFF